MYPGIVRFWPRQRRQPPCGLRGLPQQLIVNVGILRKSYLRPSTFQFMWVLDCVVTVWLVCIWYWGCLIGVYLVLWLFDWCVSGTVVVWLVCICILGDCFGFIFAPCISRTTVLSISQSSHYLLHKDILNTVLQHCWWSLKIRGCCSWGNYEQDCTVIYSKYFSCFSTMLVCTCVKISRWKRRIIVIQRRTN
jgi:hypothetical protein